MGFWRMIYYALGVYDYYPENIPEKNIRKKQEMLKELKKVFERHYKYENKIKFDNCILQLQLTNKSSTFEKLINKNIGLL